MVELLKQVAAAGVLVPPQFVMLMGGYEQAVLLCHFVVWSDGGGFTRSFKAMSESTLLSEGKVKAAIDKLEGMGVIVSSGKSSYLVNHDKLALLITGGESEDTDVEEKPQLPVRQEPKSTLHRDILQSYVEALGYKPSNFPREAKAAKQAAQLGYAPKDIAIAYSILKQQPFWANKHVHLAKVVEELPALVKYVNETGTAKDPREMSRADEGRAAANRLRQRLMEQGGEGLL